MADNKTASVFADWQPFENIPKDKQDFLGCFDRGGHIWQEVCFYMEMQDIYVSGRTFSTIRGELIGWMPLREPPNGYTVMKINVDNPPEEGGGGRFK